MRFHVPLTVARFSWFGVCSIVGCTLQMPSESDVFGAGKQSSGTTTARTDAGGSSGSNLGGIAGSVSNSSEGDAFHGGTASAERGGNGALNTGGNTTQRVTTAGGQNTVGGSGAGRLSGGTTGTSIDLHAGLIAHLRFDETQGTVAVNSVDTTKNATYSGNCLHPSGVLGNAVSMRNSDKQNPDWVGLPVGLLQGLSAATIAVWIRDLSSARNGGRLFDFATSATQEFYFSPIDEKPSTTTQGGHLFGTSNGSVFVDLWTSTPVTTGISAKWHHVAVSWNAASIVLYMDGVAVGTVASPGVLPGAFGATTTNWLGRTLSDAYYALYAEIDDFRVYHRALTATEVARLHQLR